MSVPPLITRARRRPPVAGEFEEYFLAGHRVPAGVYHQVGGPRKVRLEQEGILPASCDGKVAVYVRRPLARERKGSRVKDLGQ